MAGKAAISKMMATPAIPTVFLRRTEALMTVSVASVNIRPITGTKFPVTNLAVLIDTPSETAAVVPWTEITPRKMVMKAPNSPMLHVLRSCASCVTL